ncbi:hypothetical protein Leryth_006990 [Lithospermum erythrorhizon]|nr:hypothetical protein Leryth_006990 [Lithospermum erythrorhizon]
MHQPNETTPFYQPPTAPPPDYPPSPHNPNPPPNYNQYNQTHSMPQLNPDYSYPPGQNPAPYSYTPTVSIYQSNGGNNNSAPKTGPGVSNYGGYSDQGGIYTSTVLSAPNSGPEVSNYDNSSKSNGGYGHQGGNYSSIVSTTGSYGPDHSLAPNSGPWVSDYGGYSDQGGNYSSTVSGGSYAPPKVSNYDSLNESNGGYGGYDHHGGNYSSSVSSGSYKPVNNAASYSAPPVPGYDSNGGYGGYGDQGGNFSSSVSGSHSSGSYAPPGHNSAPFSAPAVSSYDNGSDGNGGYGGYGDQGVYKYSGGKKAVDVGYGGGKGREESAGSVLFDDYGRPISGFNGREQSGGRIAPKIVKAVPKVDEHSDVKSGVQKYRVKILSEGYGQPDMDVLCQIGLDGIRILEPSTGRMLKIYSLETVTRWEVLDTYIFAFWAKTSVDAEPRRIRLKSNSHTTNNILDTVTAASIQVKEIGAIKPSESAKETEQPSEKKKGLTDWVNFIKPGNEEKDHWVPDEAVAKCTACGGAFSAFNRRHHCRNCGDLFCDKCTQGRIALTADENAQAVRVCDQCMAEVTQRLSNTKEAAVRVTGLQSHEDLAKKLQEVMNMNRKTSSGSVSGGSRTQMREVACPTCTVHLQVQVPATGSETIECSVCQQPFLVSAH